MSDANKIVAAILAVEASQHARSNSKPVGQAVSGMDYEGAIIGRYQKILAELQKSTNSGN